MAKVTVKFAPKAQDDLDEIEEYYEDYHNSKQMLQIFDRIDDNYKQQDKSIPATILNFLNNNTVHRTNHPTKQPGGRFYHRR